jgi:hypothetical protein
MGISISDRQVKRIWIIDDDESARASYQDSLVGSVFEVSSPDNMAPDPDLFFKGLEPTDAIISDHQLKAKNYFSINGAELVAKCYHQKIPSILVTKYDKVQMTEIRRFRKFIPVLINPREFDVDRIPDKLSICINEFNGNIRTDRKLHQTLARIDSVDDTHIYIIIPGWDSKEIIAIDKSELPEQYKDALLEDKRLLVRSNIGCEKKDDLFFENWEIRK